MGTGESCRCLAFQYRITYIWMSVIITAILKAIIFQNAENSNTSHKTEIITNGG
jgi:hypothetical protein